MKTIATTRTLLPGLLLLLAALPAQGRWEWLNPRPRGAARAVWGVDGSNAVFVGTREDDTRGMVSIWDGQDWRDVDCPDFSELYSVWGRSMSDFYVGGDSKLYHYKGIALLSCAEAPRGRYLDLQGIAPDHLFAVLELGVDSYAVWHQTEDRWTEILSTPTNPSPIWCSAADDFWAAGEEGLLRWNGNDWQAVALPVEVRIHDLWGADAEFLLAVGSRGTDSYIFRWDGMSWTEMDFPIPPTQVPFTLLSVHGVSRDCAIAVGGNEAYHHSPILLEWDGSVWSLFDLEECRFPYRVFGAADGNFWILNGRGPLYHQDDGVWVREERGITGGLDGVWAAGSEDIYAVGFEDRAGIIVHWDGESFTNMQLPEGIASLLDIWGTGHDDIFAVGEEGTILHWDGDEWQAMSTPTSCILRGIWGSASDDVFACGNSGTILHWDGSEWSIQDSPTALRLNGIFGFNSNDVTIVGGVEYPTAHDVVLHWDGSSWSEVPLTTPYIFSLLDVWGAAPNDIYAVGMNISGDSVVLHWDGVLWSDLLYSARPIRALEGSTSGEILLASQNQVLRSDGIACRPMTLYSSLGWDLTSPEPGCFIIVCGASEVIRWRPDLGVHLEMPRSVCAGDLCYVDGYLENPASPMQDVPVFFFLEAFGSYWFWPSWTEYPAVGVDYRVMDVPTGTTRIEVVPEFVWPEDAGGPVYGLRFWGAMLDPGMTEILGDFDVVEWEYIP